MADYSEENYMSSILNFESHIGNIGWSYTHRAVQRIFERSYSQKEHILAVLRKHPNYVEEKQAIVFSADYQRDVDWEGVYDFTQWCSRKAQALYSERFPDEDIYAHNSLYWSLGTFVSYLADSTDQFLSDEYKLEWMNDFCANNEKLELKKLKFHRGQKRSRVVGKFCRMFGIDKFDDFDAMFAMYGDSINPMTIQRFTVISVNPADFLMMSNGTSWSSCHNPDKETYSGCNCSGGISHALDRSSIIMYTVHPNYQGDLQNAGKVDRCIFFVDENLEHFVQSKVYPDGSSQKSNEFREIFQKIWSDCTGKPNLWTKSKDSSRDFITSGDGATAYPDFLYEDRNIIVHFYLSSANTENFKRIYAGARPMCVECGCEHDYKDEINCCTRYGNYCENCDSQLDGDYTYEVFSEFHDARGCNDCMYYNDWCNDWFYNSDDTEWVPSVREYIPTCYLEWSDDFERCEECGDWVYVGGYEGEDYVEDADYNIYCIHCGEDMLRECADCGKLYDKDIMYYYKGEWYCEACFDELKDSEEFDESEVA